MATALSAVPVSRPLTSAVLELVASLIRNHPLYYNNISDSDLFYLDFDWWHNSTPRKGIRHNRIRIWTMYHHLSSEIWPPIPPMPQDVQNQINDLYNQVSQIIKSNLPSSAYRIIRTSKPQRISPSQNSTTLFPDISLITYYQSYS